MGEVPPEGLSPAGALYHGSFPQNPDARTDASLRAHFPKASAIFDAFNIPLRIRVATAPSFETSPLEDSIRFLASIETLRLPPAAIPRHLAYQMLGEAHAESLHMGPSHDPVLNFQSALSVNESRSRMRWKNPFVDGQNIEVFPCSFQVLPYALARTLIGVREAAQPYYFAMYLDPKEAHQLPRSPRTHERYRAPHVPGAFAYIRFYIREGTYVAAEIQSDEHARLSCPKSRERYKSWPDLLLTAFMDFVETHAGPGASGSLGMTDAAYQRRRWPLSKRTDEAFYLSAGDGRTVRKFTHPIRPKVASMLYDALPRRLEFQLRAGRLFAEETIHGDHPCRTDRLWEMRISDLADSPYLLSFQRVRELNRLPPRSVWLKRCEDAATFIQPRLPPAPSSSRNSPQPPVTIINSIPFVALEEAARPDPHGLHWRVVLEAKEQQQLAATQPECQALARLGHPIIMPQNSPSAALSLDDLFARTWDTSLPRILASSPSDGPPLLQVGGHAQIVLYGSGTTDTPDRSTVFSPLEGYQIPIYRERKPKPEPVATIGGAHLDSIRFEFQRACALHWLLRDVGAPATALATPLDYGVPSTVPVRHDARIVALPEPTYRALFLYGSPHQLGVLRMSTPCGIRLHTLFEYLTRSLIPSAEAKISPSQAKLRIDNAMGFLYEVHGETYAAPAAPPAIALFTLNRASAARSALLLYLAESHKLNAPAADRIYRRIAGALLTLAGAVHGAGGTFGASAPTAFTPGKSEIDCGMLAPWMCDIAGRVHSCGTHLDVPWMSLFGYETLLSRVTAPDSQRARATGRYLDLVSLQSTLALWGRILRGSSAPRWGSVPQYPLSPSSEIRQAPPAATMEAGQRLIEWQRIPLPRERKKDLWGRRVPGSSAVPKVRFLDDTSGEIYREAFAKAVEFRRARLTER